MFASEEIKRLALSQGFTACGIARAAVLSSQRQEEWRQHLAEGRHADMRYLANNLDKRFDPRLLVPGAKSIIVVAMNYYPGREAEAKGPLQLARYALGTDYHEVVKQRLRAIVAGMGWTEGEQTRVFVDTAPIDEKYWAQEAGLGWRGRNSQLIIPGKGSYFFLGEIVTTEETDRYDPPFTKQHCGTCHACFDACPAKALLGNGTLDARRCLSYLTIEHRGSLSPEVKAQMGPCFYGCDRCAEACPHNRFATPTAVEPLLPRPDILAMTREDWEHLTPEKYKALFTHSAVKRAKFEGLKRNLFVEEGEKRNDSE